MPNISQETYELMLRGLALWDEKWREEHKCDTWPVATNARTLSTTRNCEKQEGESATSISKTSGIGTQPIAQRTAHIGSRWKGEKMAKKRPEEISVGAYNKLMIDDALQMLKDALVEVRELRSLVNDMQTAAQNAEENITEAQAQFEQMRLDI